MQPVWRVTLLSLFLWAGAGCGSPGGRTGTLDVTLINASTVRMDDVTGPVNALPRRLKSAGAGPETAINVVIPARMSTRDLGQITAVLSKAGFRKVLFVRARPSP